MKGTGFKVFIIFFFVAVLSGAAIFIGWRLRQETDLTPEESEAATTCTSGDDCPTCNYPLVAFCNLEWNEDQSACINGVCGCKDLPQPTGGCNDPSCPEKSDPLSVRKCEPPPCPDDWQDCGTTYTKETLPADPPAGCTTFWDLNCETTCRACTNKTKIYRFCKQGSTTTTTTTSTTTGSTSSTTTSTSGSTSTTSTTIHTTTTTIFHTTTTLPITGLERESVKMIFFGIGSLLFGILSISLLSSEQVITKIPLSIFNPSANLTNRKIFEKKVKKKIS